MEEELIIIMYIYYALINALSAHMIHINLNIIFYTHVEHSPTETIFCLFAYFFPGSLQTQTIQLNRIRLRGRQ